MLAGCEHSPSFAPTHYAPDQPFNAPPLIRLTLNPGVDMIPAWLPDGQIVFTAQRGDRADHDRCFAIMPGSGAAISRYVCRTSISNDSLDAFTEAAPSSQGGGQIAYVREGSYRLPVPPITPALNAIVVAPLADPNNSHVVRTFPYFAPSGRAHWGLSHLHWLDASRLIYVGEDVSYPVPCQTCPPDTVRVGLEITMLDLSTSPASLTIVPGTDNATSVSVGASSDTIYFTRAGESVIYRHMFASGVTDTVHDFGGNPARDVAWAAGQLFVVVDGTTGVGGDVHILGLATGADSLVPAPPSLGGFVAYDRVAPSSDGRRFIAQGYLFTLTGVMTSGLELWLYELP